MGIPNKIDKYQIIRTIGEGSFSKVKLAINTINGQYVALKIIDKLMVMENNLVYQVQREIKAMKLLHHPNIVRIHEVIGSRTKIYIVMEYVPGGLLSEKMSYMKKLSEREARKHFQQLIDAVDYCHFREVYHRDLKPHNLLLDNKGNLKLSDFGLSEWRKPETLLLTACGSPSYVAPELLTYGAYDGEAADIWSCGVILFELLAGYLPFDDCNLALLYRKIHKAEYAYPEWITKEQRWLISRMLDPNPKTRMRIAEIIEDNWFQVDYEPATQIEYEERINSDDVYSSFNSLKETAGPSSFINAFELIAMSDDLDLSRLFEEPGSEKKKTTLGSKHTIGDIIMKLEAAAKRTSLSLKTINNSNKLQMKIHLKRMTRSSRSCLNLLVQVTEVAPKYCAIEIYKSAGEMGLYEELLEYIDSRKRYPS